MKPFALTGEFDLLKVRVFPRRIPTRERETERALSFTRFDDLKMLSLQRSLHTLSRGNEKRKGVAESRRVFIREITTSERVDVHQG